MPTTDNSIRRRHEKKHFTPAEVISALQYIGAMSPIELLTAGYINIPAVNDAIILEAANADPDYSPEYMRSVGAKLGADLAGAIV